MVAQCAPQIEAFHAIVGAAEELGCAANTLDAVWQRIHRAPLEAKIRSIEDLIAWWQKNKDQDRVVSGPRTLRQVGGCLAAVLTTSGLLFAIAFQSWLSLLLVYAAVLTFAIMEILAQQKIATRSRMARKHMRARQEKATAKIQEKTKALQGIRSQLQTLPATPCRDYLSSLSFTGFGTTGEKHESPAEAARLLLERLKQLQELLRAYPGIDTRHFDFANKIREADLQAAQDLVAEVGKQFFRCPSCKVSLAGSFLSPGQEIQCGKCKATFAFPLPPRWTGD